MISFADIKPGDKVKITARMKADPNPMPVGATGTVRQVSVITDDFAQVQVIWAHPHHDRSLMLVLPEDLECASFTSTT